ncbi:hypothetical protein [Streptomyces sp. KL116D]|uniref:ABC transporter permease subunit n=1 Tax=Streptomyces sp. KL116D TaxID=3045152 RepID=UPI003558218A
MGIDTNRIIVIAFAIGGFFAAVAGVAYGFPRRLRHLRHGLRRRTQVFTAAVLGGIGNIYGAMLGGLVLGLAEGLATACIADIPGMDQFGGQGWASVWAFILLILVLPLQATRPHSANASRTGRDHDDRHHENDRRPPGRPLHPGHPASPQAPPASSSPSAPSPPWPAPCSLWTWTSEFPRRPHRHRLPRRPPAPHPHRRHPHPPLRPHPLERTRTALAQPSPAQAAPSS